MRALVLLVGLMVLASSARAQLSGSLSTPAASASWETNLETGVITVTYTISNPSGQQGGVELYKVSPYVSIYRNTPIVDGTINTTLETGQAYKINVKTLTTGGSTVSSLFADLIYLGAPEKRVRLELQNPSAEHAMKYKIFQDGVEIAEVEVGPGQSRTETIEVPSTSEVTVMAYVADLNRDGPSWVEDPGAVTELGPVFQEGEDPIFPTTVSEPPVVTIRPPSPMPPDEVPGKQSGVVWDKDTDVDQGDLLTNATFRQGVDALKAAGTKDAAGIVNALGQVKTSVDNLGTKIDGVKDALTEAPSGAPDPEGLPSEPEDVPEGPKEADGAKVDTLIDKLPEYPTVTAPGSVSAFSLPLKIPGLPQYTVEVDLADYEAGILIFKSVVRGVMAIFLFFWLVREVRGAVAN